VSGFLCEAYALVDAPEITHLGGWRAYIAQGS
jgi:allophanate hydrolase